MQALDSYFETGGAGEGLQAAGRARASTPGAGTGADAGDSNDEEMGELVPSDFQSLKSQLSLQTLKQAIPAIAQPTNLCPPSHSKLRLTS